jgi:hypothetical protein
MSTFEQNIMTQIISDLGNISIANGYSFDVGSNVFEWRDSPLVDDSELPGIIVRDPLNAVSDEDDHEHSLTLEVIIVDAGDGSPASVRQKIQDVIIAVALIETDDNVEVERAEFVSAEKEVEKGTKRLTGARLTFNLVYYANSFII